MTEDKLVFRMTVFLNVVLVVPPDEVYVMGWGSYFRNTGGILKLSGLYHTAFQSKTVEVLLLGKRDKIIEKQIYL